VVDLPFLGRELRKRQIPIIGPGIAAVQTLAEFTLLSESLSAYMMTQDADTAPAIRRVVHDALEHRGVNPGSLPVQWAPNHLPAHPRFAGDLASMRESTSGCSCRQTLAKDSYRRELLTPGHLGVFTKSAAAMLADMVKNEVTFPTCCDELGMIAVPRTA